MANKPNIRFKGFTDDWEQRKLGEMSNSYSGGTPKVGTSKYYGGKIPFIRSAEINSDTTELFLTEEGLKCSSARLVDTGDILYALYGATSGEVGRARIKGAINQAILVIKPQAGYDYEFLTQWLRKSKLNIIDRYLQGGQGNLSGTIVNELLVEFPNYEEQTKIGTYFSTLDRLITLHQRKCDETKKLKKFMLQKMFPKNGEKNPEIRFAGFTDDWEQRKLGEICERLTRKNKDNESDLPLTISSQHGLIDQRDFFNKVVAAKDMSEYYLLQKGEFAYNKSYSNGYDYGSIKRLNSYEKGCLSTLYICFKLISDKVNSDYLECYFDTLAWYHDVSQICSEGARNHGLLNVDVKAFFTEVTVKLPVDVKEQQQISAILHSLDHLITLHQRKCDKLKLIKKFMLQNMFPKKG